VRVRRAGTRGQRTNPHPALRATFSRREKEGPPTEARRSRRRDRRSVRFGSEWSPPRAGARRRRLPTAAGHEFPHCSVGGPSGPSSSIPNTNGGPTTKSKQPIDSEDINSCSIQNARAWFSTAEGWSGPPTEARRSRRRGRRFVRFGREWSPPRATAGVRHRRGLVAAACGFLGYLRRGRVCGELAQDLHV
jgi:hypothetical protein